MAIAHIANTVATAYTATGTQTTSHAGGANARAAVVLITQNGTTTDEVSGVTYAGTPMNEIVFTNSTDATEAGRIYAYWLDGVASGTQNVAMTTTASTNKQLIVATMSVGTVGNRVYLGKHGSGSNASIANPSWTISGLSASFGYMAYECIHSGLQTMTNTPASGWLLISSTDLGSQGRGFARLNTVATGVTSITAGWTAGTADDYVGGAVAFYEDLPPVNFDSWGTIFINGTG